MKESLPVKCHSCGRVVAEPVEKLHCFLCPYCRVILEYKPQYDDWIREEMRNNEDYEEND